MPAEIQRLPNGVRARADGSGDGWANAHRTELPRQFYMQDLDGFLGQIVFAANTGERLFVEYAPEPGGGEWIQRRRFGVVALFDRKRTRQYALGSGNAMSREFYVYLCRALGKQQPVTPRFFFILGGARPPWDMIEISIEDGGVSEVGQLNGNMRQVWEAAGLAEMRRRLVEWLRRPSKNCA